MIFGDEHIHTATLPTYDQARKFVDQFSLLMKRGGYTLCNSMVCNGFSELRQQPGDVSQLGYLPGGHRQYQGSPCVAKSVVINECKDTSFAFQKKLPDAHTNALQQGSNQQWGLPGPHTNVPHQTSQQWGLPNAHANVLPQGCNQQWGLPNAHTNIRQHGSNQQWGLPDARVNVLHQGSNQQWRLPDPHTNVVQQGRQQWGMPGVHANVQHQGSQQWVHPGQSPTMVIIDTSQFLNPNYPAEQQYNSRVLQDQRPPFPGGMCSMHQHQHHHQYPQNRHPGSSERYATSMATGTYDQWHQAPPQQHGSRMYQWGFQDFGRQTNNTPQMHVGRSKLVAASHPVGSPQKDSPTTGSDGSVTSFLVPPSASNHSTRHTEHIEG